MCPGFGNYLLLYSAQLSITLEAQWAFIRSLPRIRFSEPLQEQQTEHADATAVVVREENKPSEQSAKLCDH